MITKHKFAVPVIGIAVLHLAITLGYTLLRQPSGPTISGFLCVLPILWIFLMDSTLGLTPNWLFNFVLIPANSIVFAVLIWTPIYFVKGRGKKESRRTIDCTLSTEGAPSAEK